MACKKKAATELASDVPDVENSFKKLKIENESERTESNLTRGNFLTPHDYLKAPKNKAEKKVTSATCGQTVLSGNLSSRDKFNKTTSELAKSRRTAPYYTPPVTNFVKLSLHDDECDHRNCDHQASGCSNTHDSCCTSAFKQHHDPATKDASRRCCQPATSNGTKLRAARLKQPAAHTPAIDGNHLFESNHKDFHVLAASERKSPEVPPKKFKFDAAIRPSSSSSASSSSSSLDELHEPSTSPSAPATLPTMSPQQQTATTDTAQSSSTCPLHPGRCSRPCTCAQGARLDTSDLNVDELAGYLEYGVYIPKNMSWEAENMYT